MRSLYVLSLLFLSSQMSTAIADTKSDFREAYQGYQQAVASGDSVAAIAFAERSYKLGSKLYGKNNINTAKLAINYAGLLNYNEEFKKARKVLKGTLAVMEARYDEDAIDLMAPLMELGTAEFDLKKPEKSLSYFSRVSDIVSKHDSVMLRAEKNNEIAMLLVRRGAREHAGPFFEAAHHDYVSVLQPADTRVGKVSLQMAIMALRNEEFEAALDYLDTALLSFDQDGTMNQAERSVRTLMVNAFSRSGRSDEATPHCQALGEFEDPAKPPTAVYRVPLTFEQGQLRTAMGKEISLSFTVDDKGFVVNPQITSSSASELNDAALTAIASFRYAPAFEDGKPVKTTNVDYTFDFSREELRRMAGRVR